MATSGWRKGRVYLEPEPEMGGHPGYRGLMRATNYGITMPAEGAEFMWVEPGDYPNPDSWHPVEVACTVPWHRIHLVEWGNG